MHTRTAQSPRRRRWAVVGALIALCCWTGQAQAAVVYGWITKAGKPIPKAEVHLSCPGRGYDKTTPASNRGYYKFSRVPPGKCRLNDRRIDVGPGFSRHNIKR